MNIKLVSKKPHKKYAIEVDIDSVKELCKFLRNQKDRQLEVVINGKGIKFDSISGRKRYASGLEQGVGLSKDVLEVCKDTILNLTHALEYVREKSIETDKRLVEAHNKYRMKYEVMKLRKAAWEDHIAELEHDRAVLKSELDKLRNKKSMYEDTSIGVVVDKTKATKSTSTSKVKPYSKKKTKKRTRKKKVDDNK